MKRRVQNKGDDEEKRHKRDWEEDKTHYIIYGKKKYKWKFAIGHSH